MDDDVQYLGTRLAAPAPLDDPCDAHPSVTGVILHVEKCGEKPAHDLTFYRACSAYVNIGRKSGSDDRSMRRENDDHNAVFTCQVVSARHAKLVLSDSGQVYIIDLHSRHGTHLLRRGETTSRMLQAGVETLLTDGDVLTFGKVVGAGSYHVSPVTVQVELLKSHSPFEHSEDYSLDSFNPSTLVLSRPRRQSSGRYGLISTCCAESDSARSSSSLSVSPDVASSPSEQESDAEDQQSCVLAVLGDSQGKTSVKIPAFRSFIREIYNNTTSHSPVISDIPDVPFENVPGSPCSAGPVTDLSPVIVSEPLPKSRSHSPMEVATTPSPASEAQQSEPAVVGAWPISRPESPRYSSVEVETSRSEVLPVLQQDHEPEPMPVQPSDSETKITPLPNDALIEVMHRLPPPPPFFPIGGPFSNSITSDFVLPSVPPPLPLPPHRMPSFHPFHKAMAECVSSEIKGSLKSVEDRISTLQQTVNELKSRQTVTEEDVVDLQSHCDMLEPESERLLCRITGAERNIASLSILQGQMTALQNQMTTLRAMLDVSEPTPVKIPVDDVRACAEALNSLASEMKLLREDMEKRINAETGAIQSVRAEALDALREVAVEVKSVRSAKRKRDDGEATEEDTVITAPAPGSPPPVMDEVLVPEVSVPQVAVPQVPASTPNHLASEAAAPAFESTRPKKRARTAMHTIAHTTAMMAIGAAATWSALAFL